MKICWISDFDLRGSGYMNISVPMADGLAKRGHEIKAPALGYNGMEHPYDFSLIPVPSVKDALGVVQNLYNLWKFDVLVIALDLPLHEQILGMMPDKPFPYIGIMPLEADPLCMSWAMVLMQMDKSFIISQFGTDEALKVGVDAEHLKVGINLDAWRPPEPEEREQIRKALGFEEDDYIVLTVADNQERKNLSRSMEIFAEFSQGKENVKYALVTREHLHVGWKLRDLAAELGIHDKFLIFERGMEFPKLWSLYASADAFLLTSKAEGLGLPILEAMAVGLPCVATDCTALRELLADERGLLISWDYAYRDPFGNGRRYFASQRVGMKLLNGLYKGRYKVNVKKVKEYMQERSWDYAISQMERALDAVKGKYVQDNSDSPNTE
jgi:glycosyltransferase involved in cell wall biosynthesis